MHCLAQHKNRCERGVKSVRKIVGSQNLNQKSYLNSVSTEERERRGEERERERENWREE